MSNLGTSLILLVLAILLLWLAVTDKLDRAFDAWDVLIGDSTVAGATGVGAAASAAAGLPKLALSLPALPALGYRANVRA